MVNYSLAMVLKIKEYLDENDVEYAFDYDDDEATFKLVSSDNLTGESIISMVTVLHDDDDDDCIFVKAMIAVNYDSDTESVDALKAIAAYANEHSCGVRDYGCEMYVEENDEGSANMFLRAVHVFDEDICDEENEDEFSVLLGNVIGGPITEFTLIYPLIAKAFDGDEKYEELVGKLKDKIEDLETQTNSSSASSEVDMEELLDQFLAIKERAESGDVDAQIEVGKSLQILYADEECSEDDEGQSAIYWFKKAAKQGHPEARYLVARCFHEGKNVKKSRKSAIEWYKKQIDFVLESDNKDPELIKQALAGLEELGEQAATTLAYPVKYGKSTFKSVDDIIDSMDSNPDALGLFSQCTIFGASFVKRGTLGIDGLFEAANKGSTDAILGLGRLYEVGYDFLARDVDAAQTLYKYAYSLKNIDALLSLGQILFSTFGKKEIGLSMMQRAADMGSEIAETQLELIKELAYDVSLIAFDDIPKDEFKYDELQLANYLQLYFIDLSDEEALKTAILDIMMNMKPETFSVIMNEFRVKYLRRRKLMHFTDRVNFAGIFEKLVNEGLVEARKVGDYGIAENTIYSAKASTHKMKSVTLDWDDI